MGVDIAPESEPILLGYQARWAADPAQIKIGEKSRRIGFTWSEAADDVLIASRQNGPENVFYVGSRKEMALEYIEACALFARAFSIAAGEVGEEVFFDADADGDKSILTYTIRFATGKKITALSSRPSNLRGMQGTVVIDEAAFHDRLDELLKAAMALTMWGSNVRIISTHNGDANLFNEYVKDAKAGRKSYSVHTVTLDDALADGLFKRICYVKRRQLSKGVTDPEKLRQINERWGWTQEKEDAWKKKLYADAPTKEAADEEYGCIPSHGSGVYMARSLIEARMVKAPVIKLEKNSDWNIMREPLRRADIADWCKGVLLPPLEKLDKKAPHYFGMDFARTGDLSVIAPMSMGDDLMRRVPFMLEMKNIPHEQQKQILFFVCDRLPDFCGGAMDAGGNGSWLAEAAFDEYGAIIERIQLSENWYRDNMPKYKAAYEDGLIEIPRSLDIISDHRAVRLVNGVPKLPKAKTDDKRTRHGDSVIALSLAYYATQSEPEIYECRRVSKRGGRDALPGSMIRRGARRRGAL